MAIFFYVLSGIPRKKNRGFSELPVVDGYSEAARNSRLRFRVFSSFTNERGVPYVSGVPPTPDRLAHSGSNRSGQQQDASDNAVKTASL